MPTRDPHIPRKFCYLLRIEGPPEVVQAAVARRAVWKHSRKRRAIIISASPREISGCKTTRELIDYNQPEQYKPREWKSWCNQA